MKKATGRLMLVAGVGMLMLALFAVALGPVGAVDAAPQRIVERRSVLLYSGAGVTETATGSGVIAGGYANADCFVAVGVTLAQTVTVALSASADNTNWATVTTFAAISADSTVYTRTVVYGEYLRARTTLGGSNPVTATVRCVLKS